MPAKKYVVLHSVVLVGGIGHHRGAVISDELMGGSVARLLALGAIREALPDEADKESVTLADSRRVQASFEVQLADKDAEIASLKKMVLDKDAKLAVMQTELDAAKKPAASEPAGGASPTPPADDPKGSNGKKK